MLDILGVNDEEPFSTRTE